jgi:hypothetical protein
VAIKWLVGEHANPIVRLIAKGTRWAIFAAGMSGSASATLTDAQLANIADGICMALPAFLEALSHYRMRIMAWVDRRWPAVVRLPAPSEIKPPASSTVDQSRGLVP